MSLERKRKKFSFVLPIVAKIDGLEEVNNDVALNQAQFLSDMLVIINIEWQRFDM